MFYLNNIGLGMLLTSSLKNLLVLAKRDEKKKELRCLLTLLCSYPNIKTKPLQNRIHP